MMRKPFFSVIMPAYNAQNTIIHAVDSLETQSFRDFEIIIVDDGSKDQTPLVVEQLKKKYANIRSVRIKNGGPANARNAGLGLVGGRYVLFLDSDDAYLPGSLQTIHDALIADDPDILIYGFRIYNRDTDTYFHEYHPTEHWCRPLAEIDFSALYTNNLLNQIWNKAYRSDFLRRIGVTFPDHRYGEDRLFVIASCRKADRIAVCPEELYDYVLGNEDSLVHSYHADKFQVCCQIHERIQLLVQQGTGGNPEALNYMFIKSVFSCMTDLCGKKTPLSSREKRAQIRSMICQEMVITAAANCRCPNAAVRVICMVMRSRSGWLNYLLVKMAALAMRLLPNRTISLKHQH